MAESFLSALAIKVVAKKGEEFVAQVFGTKNEFQAQLANVINDTMSQFLKIHPVRQSDKIAFYESQTLVDQLLLYSFYDEYNFLELEDTLRQETNLLPIAEDELTEFIELFKSNLKGRNGL